MGVQDKLLVDTLTKMFEDQSWKMTFKTAILEDEAILAEKLEEQDEAMRLEISRIRGYEEDVENDLENVRLKVTEVEQMEETDRIEMEKAHKSCVEKRSLKDDKETELKQLNTHFKELSERALSTAELERHFPEQKHRQSLFFKITRIVFAKPKKSRPHNLRGFATNVSGTDLFPFEINTLENDRQQVQDYLWDYVSDGISDQFKKLK